MARFYGQVKGNRSAVGKVGSAISGIKSSCQSDEGSVITRMYLNDKGEVCVDIEIANRTTFTDGTLCFSGTLDEYKNILRKE